MRTFICIPVLAIFAALALTGCGFFPLQPREETAPPFIAPPEFLEDTETAEAAPPETEMDAVQEAEEEAVIPPAAEEESLAQVSGKRVIFEYNSLKLDITGMAGRESVSWNDELGHSGETPVYVLYPGAELSVIAADMVDGSLTESGEPHANWYIYRDNDQPIPIEDGMQPLKITSDMGGVGAESAYVLIFKLTGDIQ